MYKRPQNPAYNGDENIRSHNGNILQHLTKQCTLYEMNVKVTSHRQYAASHRQYVTHSMYRLLINADICYIEG